ncbi:MAG: SfiI family type II restriction endonuclease [Acidimicrobiales bacterium]
MTINPGELALDLDRLEAIEKASLRHVVQAVYEFRVEATEMFAKETDLAQDIGEDATREALDRMGTSIIPRRLYGKVDYKRARFLFHEDYSIRQALLVDSKAEKSASNARIQTAQTSMEIRQVRQGEELAVQGSVPTVLDVGGEEFLTTTVLVKYHYAEPKTGHYNLRSIIVAAIPNGMLQDRYNPNANVGFWQAGPDSPMRGEAFRTRVGYAALKAASNWRVQSIGIEVPHYAWDD